MEDEMREKLIDLHVASGIYIPKYKGDSYKHLLDQITDIITQVAQEARENMLSKEEITNIILKQDCYDQTQGHAPAMIYAEAIFKKQGG